MYNQLYICTALFYNDFLEYTINVLVQCSMFA